MTKLKTVKLRYNIAVLFRHFVELIKLRGFRYALVKVFITSIEFSRFLASAPNQWRKRLTVLIRFRVIHRAIPCLHSGGELLRIADEILLIPDSLKGDIIECGVYRGGSTCKLSIIAKLTGRKLVACDSFSGLPTPGESEEAYFKKEKYSASVNEVRDNIAHFGEPDSVELVPSWFHETLPKLKNRKFIAIFEDADLYKSVLCCVENLWPALQPGCKMFTHDFPYPAIQAYLDRNFWLHKFGYPPPPLYRAGPHLRNLAYIKKTRTATKKKTGY